MRTDTPFSLLLAERAELPVLQQHYAVLHRGFDVPGGGDRRSQLACAARRARRRGEGAATSLSRPEVNTAGDGFLGWSTAGYCIWSSMVENAALSRNPFLTSSAVT